MTERLEIRPLIPTDHKAWLAGHARRLSQQTKYDPGPVDLSKCTADWFAFLCQRHQALAQEDKVYVFGLFNGQGQHLGHIDLATIRREDNQWANIGYVLHNQFWRRGYASEAVRAALSAGFTELGYHRIEAAINLDNTASITLARRVGMQDEGIRRGFFYENDDWVDHRIFAAIPSDLDLAAQPPSR
ncbi:MAG: GNAT family protein [Chloroflexota bacterium]